MESRVRTVLLATDLDRTVMPNGSAEESPGARRRFATVAGRPEVLLVYVSGRSRALIADAIAAYDLPVPRYAIGDVGTTIFDTTGGWTPLPAWQENIAPDWRGRSAADIRALLDGIPDIRLQEAEKQNAFKVSYYAPERADRGGLLARIRRTLEPAGVRASLVWSVDDVARTGLLDVLPASATKLHALRFLCARLGVPEERTVFCGDSGNDLPVLASGFPAVLVRNAREEVREDALRLARERGVEDRLYCARGGFLGMNGNYSAGVLEGLAHFVPEARGWMGG